MQWILLSLLIISIIEISVFIWIGGMTSIWFIILMIILTGIYGIALAKQQGVDTLNRARFALSIGQVPGREILDGICIMVGAILLMTPGFVTDIVGLILLFPWSRNFFTQRILKGILEKRIYKIRR